MNQPGIEHLLADWAVWMRHDEGARGYPPAVPGLASGGASEAFEDLCARDLDMPRVRTVDACIRSLSRLESVAVHVTWLGARWPYEAADMAACYEAALVALEIALHRRGVAV